ncbi:MAG: acetamidase/formamidase family protein, partial [Mycobacteriales bacterium]
SDLVHWLESDYGLQRLDAYQLASQTVESPLANVVDTNYTSLAKLNKQWLPRRSAMDGAHTRLTELASSYRSAHS